MWERGKCEMKWARKSVWERAALKQGAKPSRIAAENI